MEKPRAIVGCGEGKAVFELVSKYGTKTVWTITADGYNLRIHGEFRLKDGTVSEGDLPKLAPIDLNTVELFI